ncbi:MAG: glycosyltransferase family 2 protein, partial [Ignavibacteriae bacterium]
MPNKISCVIITFNEEENIRRTLNSVKWCDEIVVVDSGSTDKTIELCEEFNCRIYNKEFNGYGDQKRYAVSLAANDWILSIDADEVVSDELCEEIKNIFNDDEIKFCGFFLPRALIFLGKHFKYGRESKEYYLRLFNKNYGNFSSDKVHEKVELNGDTQKLNGMLHHYSYTNIEQYFNKFNSYTTNAAQVLFDEENKGRSVAAIVLGFPVYFIKNYLIHRNILNGMQGFLWALFSSLYPVIKYFK